MIDIDVDISLSVTYECRRRFDLAEARSLEASKPLLRDTTEVEFRTLPAFACDHFAVIRWGASPYSNEFTRASPPVSLISALETAPR